VPKGRFGKKTDPLYIERPGLACMCIHDGIYTYRSACVVSDKASVWWFGGMRSDGGVIWLPATLSSDGNHALASANAVSSSSKRKAGELLERPCSSSSNGVKSWASGRVLPPAWLPLPAVSIIELLSRDDHGDSHGDNAWLRASSRSHSRFSSSDNDRHSISNAGHKKQERTC